jgi:hypothetical protein
MKVIFETNARQHLLQHLGFNAETIAAAAESIHGKTSQNGVDLAATDGAKPPAASMQGCRCIQEEGSLVGNFEAAVECCFQTGNLAALVLASWWTRLLGQDASDILWESPKRPNLSIVNAIMHNQLEEMVSDLMRWQEILCHPFDLRSVGGIPACVLSPQVIAQGGRSVTPRAPRFASCCLEFGADGSILADATR